jgi:hypothetical protein
MKSLLSLFFLVSFPAFSGSYDCTQIFSSGSRTLCPTTATSKVTATSASAAAGICKVSPKNCCRGTFSVVRQLEVKNIHTPTDKVTVSYP